MIIDKISRGFDYAFFQVLELKKGLENYLKMAQEE